MRIAPGFLLQKTLLLVLILACGVSLAAQDYFPMRFGNTWVLESQDGTERQTYTLEAPEEDFTENPDVMVLKITSDTLGIDETTTVFFVERDGEGIKLHKLVAELGSVFGIARVVFSPPVVFFPFPLKLGESWELEAATEVNLLGPVKLTSISQVVALEDVVTPAGTFKNCFKIRLRSRTVSAFVISRSTSYQWLAPGTGPVKIETNQGMVFELVSSNLLYDVTGDGVVNILDMVFAASRMGTEEPGADVNNDGIVNVLDLVLIARYIGR